MQHVTNPFPQFEKKNVEKEKKNSFFLRAVVVANTRSARHIVEQLGWFQKKKNV